MLEAPVVAEAVKIWGKRIEAEPDRAKQEHDRKMRSMELNAKFDASNRGYFLTGLALCLLFLGTVIWLLRSDKDTLLPVLTATVGLLAGAGGGFIFGQSRRE